jgi:hypothetical protein
VKLVSAASSLPQADRPSAATKGKAAKAVIFFAGVRDMFIDTPLNEVVSWPFHEIKTVRSCRPCIRLRRIHS